MNQSISVKVSSRHQIALPSAARKQLGIKAGDRLLVDVQGDIIVLLPKPVAYVDYMAGLHKDVWQKVGSTVYLNEERAAWIESGSD
ncbi:hypothetical protein MNBD_CHLOROFLEXI01-1086 [hydrothermal vent metagenome]|uniref:SpoVT-AbrB domain-containing protein n=1 Tax=hydrothermal vent metagenome TaxID=652676 RepID=A0A3B0VTX4_9ZZZZ